MLSIFLSIVIISPISDCKSTVFIWFGEIYFPIPRFIAPDELLIYCKFGVEAISVLFLPGKHRGDSVGSKVVNRSFFGKKQRTTKERPKNDRRTSFEKWALIGSVEGVGRAWVLLNNIKSGGW